MQLRFDVFFTRLRSYFTRRLCQNVEDVFGHLLYLRLPNATRLQLFQCPIVLFPFWGESFLSERLGYGAIVVMLLPMRLPKKEFLAYLGTCTPK